MDHRFTLFDYPLLEDIFMISHLPYTDPGIILENPLVEG